MFRREIDGTVYMFEVAGLYGSGNTVTERELMATGENTVYSMWDGRGIQGPRQDLYIEKYAALWGVMSMGEFLARYGDLPGVDCQWYTGQEIVVGCDEACANIGALCTPNAQAQCEEQCPSWPQPRVDCVIALESCDFQSCQ